MVQPLEGVLVLDFSTLLPGPRATLMLAEAGAEVVKIERPGSGEDIRGFAPFVDGESAVFAVLNHGKRSLALDLKDPAAVAALRPLLARADVVVEQFRPGVMERLGLGYAAVRALNPGIVYCSISGYGQDGPRAQAAGHDINYVAESGLLSISRGPDERPTMPAALVADVGGGTWPAVVNILLGLRQRERTGAGMHLDIAMAEGTMTFAFWAHAEAVIAGREVKSGEGFLAGGLPRYRLYTAGDGRQIAVGALEEKFWQAFCAAIGLPEALRDDRRDPQASAAAVAAILATRPAAEWEPLLAAADCCCSVVRTPAEALRDPHAVARGVHARQVRVGGTVAPGLPLPIAEAFRGPADRPGTAPALGADNAAFGLPPPADA